MYLLLYNVPDIVQPAGQLYFYRVAIYDADDPCGLSRARFCAQRKRSMSRHSTLRGWYNRRATLGEEDHHEGR